jgi:transposase
LAKNSSNPAIPVHVSEEQYNKYFAKYLIPAKRGPKIKIKLYGILNYILYLLHSGCQWHKIPIQKDSSGKQEISQCQVFKHFKRWVTLGFIDSIFIASVELLKDNGLLDTTVLHGDGTSTVAKKGGDNLGYNGHKHHKGDKIVAICDRNCNIIAPFIKAPGNANECPLLPEALVHLKEISQLLSIDLNGSVFSLDGGYDSKKNRKQIFNAGMIPNIPENKRNQNKTKCGRKRIFDPDIFKERFRTIERVFAWEDKFKRLLMRFEFISEMHYGLKSLAYTMINLRHFCKT